MYTNLIYLLQDSNNSKSKIFASFIKIPKKLFNNYFSRKI